LIRAFSSDYAENIRLDRYDIADLNDDDEFESLDPMARLAAERKMDRRDKREGKAQAARDGRRRARAPAFLRDDSPDSDDEAVLLGRRRRRRAYDEAQGDDDVYDAVCLVSRQI
jgi:DNA replication licensing factor MCM2